MHIYAIIIIINIIFKDCLQPKGFLFLFFGRPAVREMNEMKFESRWLWLLMNFNSKILTLRNFGPLNGKKEQQTADQRRSIRNSWNPLEKLQWSGRCLSVSNMVINFIFCAMNKWQQLCTCRPSQTCPLKSPHTHSHTRTRKWYGNNVGDNRHWAHKIWLIIQMYARNTYILI